MMQTTLHYFWLHIWNLHHPLHNWTNYYGAAITKLKNLTYIWPYVTLVTKLLFFQLHVYFYARVLPLRRLLHNFSCSQTRNCYMMSPIHVLGSCLLVCTEYWGLEMLTINRKDMKWAHGRIPHKTGEGVGSTLPVVWASSHEIYYEHFSFFWPFLYRKY